MTIFNPHKAMTKIEAEAIFFNTYLGLLNPEDDPMLAEAWNNFTDDLCKGRKITDEQYHKWTHPKFSKKERLQARTKYLENNR